VKYRLSDARELLRVEGGTVAEREATATLAVADELRDRKHSEAVADACREAARSLRRPVERSSEPEPERQARIRFGFGMTKENSE
jgi:hypothetical protein